MWCFGPLSSFLANVPSSSCVALCNALQISGNGLTVEFSSILEGGLQSMVVRSNFMLLCCKKDTDFGNILKANKMLHANLVLTWINRCSLLQFEPKAVWGDFLLQVSQGRLAANLPPPMCVNPQSLAPSLPSLTWPSVCSLFLLH